MKYKYTGVHPTVCVVEGELVQVNTGDVVNLRSAVSTEFKQVSPPIVTSPKKKKKVTQYAIRTETSGLGE